MADERTPLEEDLGRFLSAGAAAFDALPDGPARAARAARIVAWLQQHHEVLRTAGLVAFGEQAEDVRLSPELAAELLTTLAAER